MNIKKSDINLCYVLKLRNGRECYLAERKNIVNKKNEITLYSTRNKGYRGISRIDNYNEKLKHNNLPDYDIVSYQLFNSQNEAISRITNHIYPIKWIPVKEEIDWSCVESGTKFYASEEEEYVLEKDDNFICKFVMMYNNRPYFEEEGNDILFPARYYEIV